MSNLLIKKEKRKAILAKLKGWKHGMGKTTKVVLQKVFSYKIRQDSCSRSVVTRVDSTNLSNESTIEFKKKKVNAPSLSTIEEEFECDTGEQEQERFETASDTEEDQINKVINAEIAPDTKEDQIDKVTKTNLSTSSYSTAVQYTNEYDTDEQEQERFETASDTEEDQINKVINAEITPDTKEDQTDKVTKATTSKLKNHSSPEENQGLDIPVRDNNSSQYNSNGISETNDPNLLQSEYEMTPEQAQAYFDQLLNNQSTSTFNTTTTEETFDQQFSPDLDSLSTPSLPATHGSSFDLSPEETAKEKEDGEKPYLKLLEKLKKSSRTLFVKEFMKSVSLNNFFCRYSKNSTED